MSLTGVSFPGQPSRSVHFHLGACKGQARARLPDRFEHLESRGSVDCLNPVQSTVHPDRHSFPGTCPFLVLPVYCQGNRGAEDSVFSVFSSCAVIGLLSDLLGIGRGSKLPDSSDNRIYPPHIHVPLLRKTIGISTLPCLSIVTGRPNILRTRSLCLFLLREHRRSSRPSTWFQTCIG